LYYELGRVHLTLSLDVHHDSAATCVVIERARRRLRIGDWDTIDLQYHIAGLNPQLIRNSLAH
jgi:hypothetical protein